MHPRSPCTHGVTVRNGRGSGGAQCWRHGGGAEAEYFDPASILSTQKAK